jgi:hypothetical protein
MRTGRIALWAALALSACAPVKSLVPAEVRASMDYKEAYKRVVDGTKQCFGAYIIDHDLYTHKPLGTVAVTYQSRGAMIFTGNTAYQTSGYTQQVFKAQIEQKGAESVVTINDDTMAPHVKKWLAFDGSCPE